MAKFPTIGDAKSLVKKYQLDGVIVIYFKGEQFGYAEYGRNSVWCEAMKQVANQAFEAIWNSEIMLSYTEELLRFDGRKRTQERRKG